MDVIRMNCLEVQSKIMAYIDDELEDQELKSFILHVQSCKECMEELELHYILIVGTKQIDEDRNITSDFLKELQEKLNSQLREVRKKEYFFKKITFAISLVFLLIVSWQLLDLLQIVTPFFQKEEIILEEDKQDFLIERMDPYMYYDYGYNFIDPSTISSQSQNHNNRKRTKQ